MKTKLLILPIILFLLVLSANIKSQSVSYTADDYTNKLSPFKLSLTLMALDNIVPQYGLTAEGAIGSHLGYNVCFRRNLSKYIFVAKKEDVANQEDVRATNYFEAGVDYFFSDKTKDDASLKVDVGGDLYTTRYFMASVKKRLQSGIHAGILKYNKNFFTSKDTTAEGLIILENEKGQYKPRELMYTANSNNIALFCGLVFKKVKKATVHTGGWKYFRHMGRRFYLDALVGFTTFKNVTINNELYTAKAPKTSPIGYRVGFEWDQMGVVTGFEIGMRPGVQYLFPFYNYFNLNFSFNVFNGDKRYAMRGKK